MEPDLEAYERQKQEMGEDFFPGVNTLLHGTSKVSQAGVDRMAADLEKQWVGVYAWERCNSMLESDVGVIILDIILLLLQKKLYCWGELRRK